MRHFFVGSFVVFVAIGVLAGCGPNGANGSGGGGSGGGGTQYSKMGMVGMSQNADKTSGGSGTMVGGVGVFQTFDTPQQLPSDWNPFADYVDQCSVYAPTETNPFFDPFNPRDLQNTLDAGASLTVNTSGGVYATLSKNTSLGFTAYATDFLSPPPSPMPSDMTLDVPGAAGGFPSFTGKAFPAVTTFALTSPSDPTSIDTTADTSLTWSGSPTNGVVIIDAVGYDPLTQPINVECIAADDGSFSLTSAAKTKLQGYGVDYIGVTDAARLEFASYSSGDALLVVATGSGETYQ